MCEGLRSQRFFADACQSLLHPWIVRRARRGGRRPLHREDPFGGSVPGADDDPFDREDPFEGSVPGADDDPFEREDPFEGSVPGADDDREDPFGGSVPGADDDPFEREDPFEGSVPGADDDPFDLVWPFAAKLYEPPALISATVARAASGRSFLLMFHSFVW
jgi:hypothetical protein